jgi:uncharacterized membrane protein YjfL (UPF0719 family)
MTFETISTAYAITFGWAIVGSVSMGIGIVIALKLFDLATPQLDEWDLISKGNVAMAIVLASIVVAVGLVIASAVQP